jgi:hypothetical protein
MSVTPQKHGCVIGLNCFQFNRSRPVRQAFQDIYLPMINSVDTNTYGVIC